MGTSPHRQHAPRSLASTVSALVARDHDGAGERNAAMNAFWGADTDQLEQHATAMHTAAQRLVELQEQLSPW